MSNPTTVREYHVSLAQLCLAIAESYCKYTVLLLHVITIPSTTIILNLNSLVIPRICPWTPVQLLP